MQQQIIKILIIIYIDMDENAIQSPYQSALPSHVNGVQTKHQQKLDVQIRRNLFQDLYLQAYIT